MGVTQRRLAKGLIAAGGVLLASTLPAAPAAAQSLSLRSWAASTSEPPRSQSELNCMTAALYYEARGEGVVGEAAVAQVVLNRLGSPGFPKSVCAVVYQGASGPGCQFSFACDGSTRRPINPRAWLQAGVVASSALAGLIEPSVSGATHYHTLAVHPRWDVAMQPTVTLGQHQFYRRGQTARVGGARAGPDAAASARGESLKAQPASFGIWGLKVASVVPGPDGFAVKTVIAPPLALAFASPAAAATPGS